MKKLLNTLYITLENAYLSLDGENIVVEQEGEKVGRVPLHTLESIMSFGYIGASPALMGKCAEMNKSLVFLKPSGRFLAKVTGKSYGNILLRREQYRLCDDKTRSLEIARNIISIKLLNSSAVVNRTMRDHSLRIDIVAFENAYNTLKNAAKIALQTESAESLRGIEGEGASRYFAVFDQMILQQKDDFMFKSRSRRPPMDNVNALLSFAYSMLTSMCVSALESVGLDAYCGVFHTERPGRCSLALDLVEEFRSAFADRFVLTIINKKIVTDKDFTYKESGGVLLNETGRKAFLQAWQQKKRDVLMHPFLGEKVEWGLLPYVQAMLLARFIRGDLDTYPPFVWK